MFTCESGKVLVWVGIVLLELLDDVLADVGVVFFDLLGTTRQVRLLICDLHSELVLWGDLRSLPSVSQKLLDKAGNVSSGNGDVFDRRSDNVSLGLDISDGSFRSRQDIRQGLCLDDQL